MVKRVRYELEDDIDSSPAAETVSFSLDGVNFEIDLSAENAAKLRDSLQVWIKSARRTGGRRSTGRKPNTGGASADAIRTWAQENGYTVSARGRVSGEVREAYDKAHA